MMNETQAIAALMDGFGVSYSTAKRWFDKKDDLLTSKKAVLAFQKQLPPVENIHNVPVKLWKSFKTNESKLLYNSMRKLMQVPNTPNHHESNISTKDWNVFSHHAACLAAIEVSDAGLLEVDILKNRLKKSKRK